MRFTLVVFAGCFAVCQALAQFPLLVGQKVSHTVGFFGPDGGHVATVPVGRHPHELILSPDRKLLYVADNGILWMTDAGAGGNTISIIDIAGRRKIGAIDLGNYRRPHGLDIDARTGRLVATVENPDGVLLIDPRARKVLRYFALPGDVPHMVKLSPDGETAYASNTKTGSLAAISLATGDVRRIAVGARPQGCIFSPDRKLLYVTNSEGNSISVVDVSAGKSIRTIETGKGPGRIDVTRDGRQLVYNLQAGNAVGFADIAAGKQIATVDLPGPPLSLTLSPDGMLAYAGVQSLDRIAVVSVADRRIVRVVQTAKGAGPDAVIAVAPGAF